ncbi:hypothetical protein C8R45DRAFT_941310 [Mycena sanguinolenta]|nr:hypothetical protein C8R45DRAFT_941310 [Mycena sanguinolenta]
MAPPLTASANREQIDRELRRLTSGIYIIKEFFRHANNAGVIDYTVAVKIPRAHTIHAFAHFVYGHINKNVVLADIQGTPAHVNGRDFMVLFDTYPHPERRLVPISIILANTPEQVDSDEDGNDLIQSFAGSWSGSPADAPVPAAGDSAVPGS